MYLPHNLPGNISRRGCDGKQVHRSKGAADAHVRSLLKMGRSSQYHSYFCLRCTRIRQHESWHVGKAHK